ncbi:hypothetical protein HK104_000200 [Borealophlyctis nickersoniae]|nr:hypothetical protein HK104_000200 [Borealophlyctis nickersoniae]
MTATLQNKTVKISASPEPHHIIPTPHHHSDAQPPPSDRPKWWRRFPLGKDKKSRQADQVFAHTSASTNHLPYRTQNFPRQASREDLVSGGVGVVDVRAMSTDLATLEERVRFLAQRHVTGIAAARDRLRMMDDGPPSKGVFEKGCRAGPDWSGEWAGEWVGGRSREPSRERSRERSQERSMMGNGQLKREWSALEGNGRSGESVSIHVMEQVRGSSPVPVGGQDVAHQPNRRSFGARSANWDRNGFEVSTESEGGDSDQTLVMESPERTYLCASPHPRHPSPLAAPPSPPQTPAPDPGEPSPDCLLPPAESDPYRPTHRRQGSALSNISDWASSRLRRLSFGEKTSEEGLIKKQKSAISLGGRHANSSSNATSGIPASRPRQDSDARSWSFKWSSARSEDNRHSEDGLRHSFIVNDTDEVDSLSSFSPTPSYAQVLAALASAIAPPEDSMTKAAGEEREVARQVPLVRGNPPSDPEDLPPAPPVNTSPTVAPVPY